MNSLRTFRIALSALTLVSITLLYVDIGNVVSPEWSKVILALQFGPALLALFSGLSFALIGVLVVVVLTLLFGRVYCSHLCPLGTLQDIVIWFGNGATKHRKYPYARTNFTAHYLLTLAVVVTAVMGSMLLTDLLEPFSNVGRILSSLVRPAVTVVNNAIAIVGGHENFLGAERIPQPGVSVWTLLPPFLFLIFVIVLTLRSGRLFCNLLCPVGGILSILSRFSYYKITIQGSACIDCGLCERVCRARCIDSTARTVDMAACVGCFDCVGSCPTGGMSYEYQQRGKKVLSSNEEQDRRTVLLSLSAAALDSFPAPIPLRDTTILAQEYHTAKRLPVIPPGGRGVEHFSGLCTACHRCITACPSQVLQQSFLEYGWRGIQQPMMDFDVSYCTYDCTLCGEVCPTGAITHLPLGEKKLQQTGVVTFVQQECVVETKKKACGACAEHCPTKAVMMVPYGKLTIPKIEPEYCVGCGACEHACPTQPRKAIYIIPHSLHTLALRRSEERIDPKESVPEEFPF